MIGSNAGVHHDGGGDGDGGGGDGGSGSTLETARKWKTHRNWTLLQVEQHSST